MVWTHFTHLIVVIDQHVHGFDGEEAVVDGSGFAARLGLFEDVGCYDGGEVVRVHFAADFFVDLRKGRRPVEEAKEDLGRVAVGLGQEAAGEVEDTFSLLFIGDFYHVSEEFKITTIPSLTIG